jgi:hypothetical protein
MSPHDKPQLRRRHFLRGLAGVSVGLPFLEALAPRSAGAQAEPVKRFGVFFCCNGVNMDRWFPNGEFGALTNAHLQGTANEVLLPHASKLLFPRGVHMSPRGFGRDGGDGDDHAKGMAHKLTAHFADEDWLALGPSVDQIIAQQVNPGAEGSRKPPLNLMAGRLGRYRGFDYISYTGPARAVAGINNPWNAYADFMNMGGSATQPSEATDLVARRRRSVLDLVDEQFSALRNGPLSQSDREKLEAHFSAIRELETTMTAETPMMQQLTGCGDSALGERARVYEGDDELVAEAREYPVLADLMIDINALAFACDANRVSTLQFGSGAGGPVFRWDGMDHEFNHHKLSHGKVRDDCFGDSTEDGCEDVAGYEDMLFDIDVWHQTKFARLLDRLDSYTEADGKTVLDNTLMLYSNELSDGKGHSFMDLPYLMAGSCGGVFKQGEYVLLGERDAPWDDTRAPHNRLLNTVVNAMGIESDWFGVEEGAGGETMQAGVYDQLLA